MKKIIIILLIMIVTLTGCDDEPVDQYGLYKYTQWTSTDGYIIQLLEDTCKVGKDGEAFDQVCKFEPNASGTGVAKITICNKYGTDCQSIEKRYYKSSLENTSIYIYGRTFYYTGKIKRNNN